MKKRYLAVGLLALIITGVFVGRAVNAHFSYVRELDEFRARDFEGWVSAQRGVASSLDRALAEVLVSPPVRLEASLENALQQAYRGQEVYWRVGIPHAVYSAADNWGYRHHYQTIAAYLQYLLAKDGTEPLTLTEQENLALVRTYTDAFYDGFGALLPHVRYQTTTRRGHNTIRYYPWHTIVDNQDMVNLIIGLGHEINLLPAVGESDAEYSVSRAQRYQQLSTYDHYGLLYSDEREYSESELLRRAIEFMQTFAAGDVVDTWTNEPVDTGIVSSVTTSSGYGSSMGGYTGFRLRDSGTEWNYDIGATTAGGHINRIGIQEKSMNIGSRDELLQVTETLMMKWAEFEGVDLKLTRFDEEETSIHITYALVVDGIVHVDKLVVATVYLRNSHYAVEIEAGRYFMRYNAPIPGEPAITPEEAVAVLTPNLTAIGEPRLELHHENLLYAIPVEGVDRINVIYINALTGEHERMEYDYSRP